MRETHIHHIVPRHAGGSNDPSNLVELTIGEHAEAHRQLWLNNHHPFDKIAWLCLSKQIGGQEARIRASIATITPELLEKRGRGISKTKKGKKYSKEYSDIRKKACVGMHKGQANPFYNKKHTPETLDILSKNSKESKWYNDGISETFSKTQPHGFVKGRIFRRRNRK